MSLVPLVDSHCHLDFEAFDEDRLDVLQASFEVGITDVVVPGVHPPQWQTLQQLLTIEQLQLSNSPRLHGCVGLHPYFLDRITDDTDCIIDGVAEQLLTVAKQDWVVAVGECGIDSYIARGPQFDIPFQQRVFETHIDIANQLNLPLVVHHRQSHHHLLQSFKRIKPRNGGVIHAFSGSVVDAHNYIKLGFKLGCGGTITYDRAGKTQRTFGEIELEHIVLETDAPDMPIAGSQGKRNHPINLLAIAQKLAEIQHLSLEAVAIKTTQNSKALFSL